MQNHFLSTVHEVTNGQLIAGGLAILFAAFILFCLGAQWVVSVTQCVTL